MFVIGGDAPRAEFTAESVRELAANGYWEPAAPRKRRAA